MSTTNINSDLEIHLKFLESYTTKNCTSKFICLALQNVIYGYFVPDELLNEEVKIEMEKLKEYDVSTWFCEFDKVFNDLKRLDLKKRACGFSKSLLFFSRMIKTINPDEVEFLEMFTMLTRRTIALYEEISLHEFNLEQFKNLDLELVDEEMFRNEFFIYQETPQPNYTNRFRMFYHYVILMLKNMHWNERIKWTEVWDKNMDLRNIRRIGSICKKKLEKVNYFVEVFEPEKLFALKEVLINVLEYVRKLGKVIKTEKIGGPLKEWAFDLESELERIEVVRERMYKELIKIAKDRELELKDEKRKGFLKIKKVKPFDRKRFTNLLKDVYRLEEHKKNTLNEVLDPKYSVLYPTVLSTLDQSEMFGEYMEKKGLKQKIKDLF